MIGKTLALANRSLRSDARGMGFALTCCVLAFSLLVVIEQFGRQSYRSTPGFNAFEMITYMNYWAITVAGGSYFATAITEEKEDRTLELLRIAGMTPLAILAGKWVPRMMAAMLVLCVQLPFAFLCVTLGGLTWQQVLAVFTTLFAYLVLSGSVGLWMSVVMRSSGAAAIGTILLLLAMAGLPFAFYSAGGFASSPVLNPFNQVFKLFLECESIYRITTIFQPGAYPALVGWQFTANLILAVLCCGLAWLLFNRCTENEGQSPGVSWLFRTTKHIMRRPTARRAWESAITGKDFHQFAWGLWGLLARFVCYTLIFSFWFGGSGIGSLRNRAEIVVGLSLIAILGELGILVSRQFREEMTSRTWATLCMLPRTTESITRDKLLGGLPCVIPGGVFLVFGISLYPQMLNDLSRELFDAEGALLLFCIVLCLLALYVAAWISISFRWGIWPVAVALASAVPTLPVALVMNLLSPNKETALILVFLTCFTVVVLWRIHGLLKDKLKVLASE